MLIVVNFPVLIFQQILDALQSRQSLAVLPSPELWFLLSHFHQTSDGLILLLFYIYHSLHYIANDVVLNHIHTLD